MYESTSVLSEPANSRQPLWRYFPYERLRDLLISEELFFTHLPIFSDGLEGSLTLRTRIRLTGWFTGKGSSVSVARLEVAAYEKHQEQFYASCWHMNRRESYLMWKAYADRGFAVQTTFERVRASFDSFEGVINGGIVNYVNFERDDTPLGNVFNHVITKDLPYTDEREFRLVFWQPDPRNQNLKPVEKGIRVRVDLQMLIEQIYINPIETVVLSDIADLLERKGIKCSSSIINYRQSR